MTSPVSDHDRRRAWLAMRRRAESGAPSSWRSPEIDDAILARASDRRFDALLVEGAAADWDAVASALGEAVIADLTAAWPGHADTARTYVGLQLYDWLMLPSRAAMATFVGASARVRDAWGLQRDLFNQVRGSQTFHPDRRDVPRVVLRDVPGAMLVDLVDSWPHLQGFTAVTAVADTDGHLFVLDVRARENLLVPTALLIDLEKLCRGWGALLAEYRSTTYQAEMNIGHNGIAPLPSRR